MNMNNKLLFLISILLASAFACNSLVGFPSPVNPTITIAVPTPTRPPTPTPILEVPVRAGEENPDEPVLITGTIPFTSPFFLDGNAEPFVLLEDQAGFVARDLEFSFPLAGQAIGPVELIDEQTLSYSLTLPVVPQGTLIDVDNDGEEEEGVMIFCVAYWSNTWGGPFLEERDGTGWSGAYASTITDPNRDYEITGGHLIIWAPDKDQSFPSGFGEDNLLFTADDPVQPVNSGYSIVNLGEDPFSVYKESNPQFVLIEGSGEVKDFSDLSRGEAFDAMFEKVSVEYPFTAEKGIDWDALYDEYASSIHDARNPDAYHRALHDFLLAIPDAHVGMSFNAQVFYDDFGGSFGLLLAELSDNRVIVTDVLPDTTGGIEGILPGAEIISWDGLPVSEALDQVDPYFGPYSTDQHMRYDQLVFLTRYPPETRVSIQYQNPDGNPEDATLSAEIEYDSLFESIPAFTLDEMGLPLEAEILDESGLGYIRINTFSDDYNLMARLWERFIETLIEEEVPGLIIDMRINGGGNGGLANDFVGYFFNQEVTVSQHAYYNERLEEFEYTDFPTIIKPGPMHYDGPIAVLVSPFCVSACEGFSYALSLNERSIMIGQSPTAGAYGEVGRGQYELPEEISVQFPTGRSETPDGDLLIEGVGVALDITVPITEESALGLTDPVLEEAINTLLEMLE
jgi:C-terminal processing protease CtpA/Prc